MNQIQCNFSKFGKKLFEKMHLSLKQMCMGETDLKRIHHMFIRRSLDRIRPDNSINYYIIINIFLG